MSEGPQTFNSQAALAFQRRNWAAERAGWAVLALLLACAGAGLFGSGPLSETEVRSADGTLGVRYARFVRREHGVPLRVRFRDAQGGMARVWFDARYLEDAQLEQVTPQPDSVEMAGERLVYAFRSREGAGEVVFRFRAERPGLRSARFGLGAATVELHQLVYP